MAKIAASLRRAVLIWNVYGVEVYDHAGEFVGGLTDRRLAAGPEAVADALRSILQALEFDVILRRDP